MKNNVLCCNFCLALEGLTNPLISGADLFGDYRIIIIFTFSDIYNIYVPYQENRVLT